MKSFTSRFSKVGNQPGDSPPSYIHRRSGLTPEREQGPSSAGPASSWPRKLRKGAHGWGGRGRRGATGRHGPTHPYTDGTLRPSRRPGSSQAGHWGGQGQISFSISQHPQQCLPRLSNLTSSRKPKWCHQVHFADEETKAPRENVTWQGKHPPQYF